MNMLEGYKVVGFNKETTEFNVSEEEYTKDEADSIADQNRTKEPGYVWSVWTASEADENYGGKSLKDS